MSLWYLSTGFTSDKSSGKSEILRTNWFLWTGKIGVLSKPIHLVASLFNAA
jgi:hypothetical protein